MIESGYSMSKFTRLLLAGGLLALMQSALMAQVSPMPFNCALEVAEIKTVIANERFDEYTLKQLQSLMQDVEKALASKADTACVEDVAKLKHILHLDH